MQQIKGFALAGEKDVAIATPARSINADKYSHGAVLVIGGNKNYRNAPLLAAFAARASLSASRVGAGYVTIAGPEEVIRLALALSYGPVVRVLTGRKEDLETIKGVKHNTLVLGPGFDIPDTTANRKMITAIMKYEKAAGNIVVVDASALKFFKSGGAPHWKNVIITPHMGEYKKLTGVDLKKASLAEKVRSVMEVAGQLGCIILLKGNITIITDGKRVKLNKAKTPVLSTQGTGDVLSGIIAGYASIHGDPFESAVAGAYIHAKVGDTLYKKMGLHIVARDIIDAIPDVLKRYDTISDK